MSSTGPVFGNDCQLTCGSLENLEFIDIKEEKLDTSELNLTNNQDDLKIKDFKEAQVPEITKDVSTDIAKKEHKAKRKQKGSIKTKLLHLPTLQTQILF